MAPTNWGIVSAGKISSDFVNAILSLNDPASHKVMMGNSFLFNKTILFLNHYYFKIGGGRCS